MEGRLGILSLIRWQVNSVKQSSKLGNIVHLSQNRLIFFEQVKQMSVISFQNQRNGLEEVAPFFDGNPQGVS